MTKQEIIDYMYENHVQGDFKIEEMAEDLAQPQWIPVSERLPGVETDVLLQFSRNMCVGFLDQDNGWKIYSGGCWLTDILEGDLQPTAWMPLPKSYKKKE